MTYEILFDERGIEYLRKISKHLRKRIFNKISSTKKDPFHYFERLTGRKDYKLRIGNYRAIADIDKKEKTIKITVIGHRKNIYKSF